MGQMLVPSPAVRLPVIVTGVEACAKCEGSCCKTHPGATSPLAWMDDEGKLDLQKIETALRSKKWVIDSRYIRDFGDCETFYIRPATTNFGSKLESVFDRKLRVVSSPCIFLGDSGCELDEGTRPKQCLELEARIEVSDYGLGENIDHRCRYPGGVRSDLSVVASWVPFSDELEAFGEKLDGNEDD